MQIARRLRTVLLRDHPLRVGHVGKKLAGAVVFEEGHKGIVRAREFLTRVEIDQTEKSQSVAEFVQQHSHKIEIPTFVAI